MLHWGEFRGKGKDEDNLIILNGFWGATLYRPLQDETHWCSAFANWALEQAGFGGTATMPGPVEKGKKLGGARALDWLDWGAPLKDPAVGAIVVFKRGKGGHVGFIAGRDITGGLVVLGGNQRDPTSGQDEVRYSSYSQLPLGVRVPMDYVLPSANFILPVLSEATNWE